MKRILAALVFVIAFAFLPAFPIQSADCLYGEWPDGGCKPAPGTTATPTPRPTPTPVGQTPRPTAQPALSASVICNNVTRYNEITIRVNYAGATEIWSESDAWSMQLNYRGTGTYTIKWSVSATFNKMDLYLMPAGTRGPLYANDISNVAVHAVWGAGWNC